MNAIPVKNTRQHKLANEAIEYAESTCDGLPASARRAAALARVALWSVGSEAQYLGVDSVIGFVVRVATGLVVKHYEGGDQ